MELGSVSPTKRPLPLFKIIKSRKRPSAANSPKPSWTKEHDEYLAIVATQSKGRNWGVVAEKMRARFPDLHPEPKKCRERWLNCARPDVRRTAFTDEEELALLMHHYTYKSRWALIIKKIPNRSSNYLKNNFYSLIRRQVTSILEAQKIGPAQEVGSSEFQGDRKILTTVPVQVTSATSALGFLEAIFSVLVVTELLRLKGPPSPGSGVAPAYIYEFVREKHLTEAMCENYLQRAIDEFLALAADKSYLLKLKQIKGLDGVNEMFGRIVSLYNEGQIRGGNVEEFIMTMLRQVLDPAAAEFDLPMPMADPVILDLESEDQADYEQLKMVRAVEDGNDNNDEKDEDEKNVSATPRGGFGACCTKSNVSKKFMIYKARTQTDGDCYEVFPGEPITSSSACARNLVIVHKAADESAFQEEEKE